jgi:phytoene dehydrogenase-like protein
MQNSVNYDAIIIGAGHNGLVTAALLARAGKKVLMLERRREIGGIVTTEEIHPGFKLSTCAHLAGSFCPQVIAQLELNKYGLEFLAVDPISFVPDPGKKSLVLSRDPAKLGEELGRHSKKDQENFASFRSLTRKLAAFLRALYDLPLPDHGSPASFNPAKLIRLGWKFHRLGKKEMVEFLRIFPMSITDWLNEWFETDALKAALSAGGIHGQFYGPRAQGTSYVFLHHQLGETNGALRAASFVRGGLGNLANAIAAAAKHFGAEIRTEAEVERIIIKENRATGVALKNGDEITAQWVISNADIKRTFLKLVGPPSLDPHFLLQVKNLRARGAMAKINLALDTLPKFTCAPDHVSAASLGGIIHIGSSPDYLERAADEAKYGRFSIRPFLEITVPSLADPALAPPGKHVMSVWMQYAPYHLKDSSWDAERKALADCVVETIEEVAPGFKSSILARQVLTPLDLEKYFALTEGHIYHGELALDQIFFMRPVAGWARYHTPIENLFLCGSGTHPGGDITGLPGYYAAKEILKGTRKAK